VLLSLVSACGGQSSPAPLTSQLESLRAENGLYSRPGAGNDVSDDVISSAYGLTVLNLAGRRPQNPWTSPQARQTAVSATSRNSVFGTWAIQLIDEATASGSAASGTALISSVDADGFFEDHPARPKDLATRLASTNSALYVLSQQRLALSRPQRKSIQSWLGRMALSVANPYQACQLLSAARFVHVQVGTHATEEVVSRWESAHTAVELNSEEDVLDAYGDICVRNLMPTELGVGPIRQKDLEPYLRRPSTPSIAYHLARAWIMLKGAPAALSSLAEDMQARINAPTHLLKSDITVTGTLDTSYDVTALRRMEGLSIDDEQLVAAVRATQGLHAPDTSGLQELLELAVLRGAGAPDKARERKAVDQALGAVPVSLDQSNIGTWARLSDLLVLFELPQPRGLTFVPWPTTSPLSRYNAWMAVGLPLHLIGASPRDVFRRVLDGTGQLLQDKGSQLAAATTALYKTGRPLPLIQIRQALVNLRGCPGLPDLYRPAPQATDCDVNATLSAQQLQALLNKTTGGS
jgi:hypothetical protein